MLRAPVAFPEQTHFLKRAAWLPAPSGLHGLSDSRGPEAARHDTWGAQHPSGFHQCRAGPAAAAAAQRATNRCIPPRSPFRFLTTCFGLPGGGACFRRRARLQPTGDRQPALPVRSSNVQAVTKNRGIRIALSRAPCRSTLGFNQEVIGQKRMCNRPHRSGASR
jgi:hypothetical protein